MANSSQDGRSRSRGSGNSSGRRSGGRRSPSSRNGSHNRRPQGSRDGSTSRRGTLQRPDTGYTLHSRRVRKESKLQTILQTLMRPRVLLFIALIIVVVVVLFVGVTSCINRGNEAARATTEEAKPKNEQDQRVAAGVSASMTSRFTEALDQGELVERIAAQANEYDDDRLLVLALAEPSALQFVADYPSSDKSSGHYTDELTRGEVPTLYNWDKRWGAVTYGDGPLAVTGSGPTTMAMAYMGLTGKSDFTPVEIAQQSSKSNYTGTDSGTKAEMFMKLAEQMGLDAQSYDPSADTLYALGDNTVFAVEVKAGTLTDDAHWVLVIGMNADGSVRVLDPTSTMVSSRPWAASTIADAATTFCGLSASDATLLELESATTEEEEEEDMVDDTGTDTDATSSSSSSTSTSSSSSSSSSSNKTKNSSSSSSSSTTDTEESSDSEYGDYTEDSEY